MTPRAIRATASWIAPGVVSPGLTLGLGETAVVDLHIATRGSLEGARCLQLKTMKCGFEIA